MPPSELAKIEFYVEFGGVKDKKFFKGAKLKNLKGGIYKKIVDLVFWQPDESILCFGCTQFDNFCGKLKSRFF